MDIDIVTSLFEEHIILKRIHHESIFRELELINLSLVIDKRIPIEYRFKNMRCFAVFMSYGDYEVNSFHATDISVEEASEIYRKQPISTVDYLLLCGTKKELTKFKLKYL